MIEFGGFYRFNLKDFKDYVVLIINQGRGIYLRLHLNAFPSCLRAIERDRVEERVIERDTEGKNERESQMISQLKQVLLL